MSRRLMTRGPSAVLALALGLALVGTWGRAGAAEGGKTTVEKDIVYKKAGDAELKLDLARPSEGTGPFPAVVVIHGGAWRGGNKKDVAQMLTVLAGRGYVAISPQYRFCPKDLFPAQVHDVKAAVRWIKTNAEKYHVDARHVGAMGFSAGGHLALMLGVTAPKDGLEGDVGSSADGVDSRVQAVVNYFGPTDLAAADIPEVSRPLVRDFLDGPPEEKPVLAAKASPLTFVSKDDPPILTFQGTKDPLVPHTQALKLAETMTARGVPGRVVLMAGSGHGWAGKDLEATVSATVRFFDRYLKAPPQKPDAEAKASARAAVPARSASE